MSGSKAAAPYLVDIAVNLTDCVFHGVDWSGKRLHDDDFNLMLKRAEDNGVHQMIITGTNLLQSEKAIALCRRYPDRRLLCTVGVHPAHSCEFQRPAPDAAAVAGFLGDDASVIEPTSNAGLTVSAEEESAHAAERIARLVRLIDENRGVVIAVGEIGMDYAELLYCPREIQEKYFVAQMRAFAPLGLPFLFHSRECGMHFHDLLEAEALANPAMRRRPAALGDADSAIPQLSGVVHSFNGTQDEQDKLLAMGLYLSLNGSSFREQEVARQVVRIPRHRVLLETDAPWCDIRQKDYGYGFVKTHFDTVKRKKPFVLGKCLERRNEPCHMVQVVEAYLGCLNAEESEGGGAVTKEEVTRQLYDNCKAAFKL